MLAQIMSRIATCLIFLPFLALSLALPWPTKSDEPLLETFNWGPLEPSYKLHYTPCYEGLECARLLVPLDWTQPNVTDEWQEVALAVARLPAKVPPSSPKFGGTIVLNPGGPSGSGVDFLRWLGPGIQAIVDGDKQFEILSFDPRGTKYSTPNAACFDSDLDRSAWAQQLTDSGGVDEGDYSFNVKWALAQGFGTLCEQTALGLFPDGTSIRQYISTKQVAYDMIKIIDAVEEELKCSLSTSQPPNSQQTLASSEAPVLNYWGFSYGTYLGNTFASIFPERIGRMILDGVVDAPDYTATGWTTNLQDNDKVWDLFYQWCVEAGSRCAILDGNIKTAAELRHKITLFMNDIRENPLPVLYEGRIILLTHLSLTAAFHLASYGPWQFWPLLALQLQLLIEANTVRLLTSDHAFSLSSLFRSNPNLPFLNPYLIFSNNSDPFPSAYAYTLEASAAILCGDGEDITFETKQNFTNYISHLTSQSSLIGPLWAQITLLCRHWPSSQRPSEHLRFTGPFSSSLKDYNKDRRTSPLLFIGNTADPVTPLRNAKKMSEGHEGSRVLVQDSPGHCSGVTVPSLCTWEVIRKFYNTGILPEDGMTCGIDWKPWDL